MVHAMPLRHQIYFEGSLKSFVTELSRIILYNQLHSIWVALQTLESNWNISSCHSLNERSISIWVISAFSSPSREILRWCVNMDLIKEQDCADDPLFRFGR